MKNKRAFAKSPAVARSTRLTQIERRAQSEQRIIDAAIDLIAQKGVVRVTLAETGEKAGYSRGLPAHLFKTKSKLICECAKRIVQLRAARVASVEPDPGIDALFGIIRTWLKLVEENPDGTRSYYIFLGETYYAESAVLFPEVRDIVLEADRSIRKRFVECLRNAKQRREIRSDVQPEIMARFIFALLRGIVSQWLTDPECESLRRLSDSFLKELRGRLLPVRKQS